MPKTSRAKLTPAMEDYLKAIYRLEQVRPGAVGTNDLAAEMHVTPSSATTMIKALTRLGMTAHTPYHGVSLTSAGSLVALEVIRHHRLIERYLQECLGFRWDEVHEEADALEHAISERLEDRLAELLGNPKTDPHGEPIPTRDGAVAAPVLLPLSAIAAGDRWIVGRVGTSDPEKLRYLAAKGLIPGAVVACLDIAPFGGPIRLLAGDSELSIGAELAAELLMEPANENGAAAGGEAH